jgi:hypothetical protein
VSKAGKRARRKRTLNLNFREQAKSFIQCCQLLVSTRKRRCSREELWLHAKSPNNSVTEAICSAFGSIVKVSHHYQPITATLYASRMATVASAIQADKV